MDTKQKVERLAELVEKAVWSKVFSESETIGLAGLLVWFQEEALSLESKLTTARERIKQLERCAVLGGDGEPIVVGKEVFTKSNGFEYAGKIESIFEAVNGEITATIFIDQGKTPTYYKRMSKEVYNFYSTSEAVPETLSRKETKQ